MRLLVALFHIATALAVTCPADNPFCQCNLCSSPTSQNLCPNTAAFDKQFGTSTAISTFNPICSSLPLALPAGQVDGRRWNATAQGSCYNSFFLPTQFSEVGGEISCGGCEVCRCAPPLTGQYGQKQIGIGLCCDPTNAYGGAGCQCQQNGLTVTSGATYGPGQICSGGQTGAYCTVNGYYFPNPAVIANPIVYTAYQTFQWQNWPWVEPIAIANYNSGVAQQALPNLYSFTLQATNDPPGTGNVPSSLVFFATPKIPYYIGVANFGGEGYQLIWGQTQGTFYKGFQLNVFPYNEILTPDGQAQGINTFTYDPIMQQIFWANGTETAVPVSPKILCAYCFTSGGRDCNGHTSVIWGGEPGDWNDVRCNYWRILNYDPLAATSTAVRIVYDPPPNLVVSPFFAGCVSTITDPGAGRSRMTITACTDLSTLFTINRGQPMPVVDANIILNTNVTSGSLTFRWFLCPGSGPDPAALCQYWITQTNSTQANSALTPLMQNCDVCSVCVCPGQRPENGFNPTTGVGFCCPVSTLPATDSDFACTINAAGSGGVYGTCIPGTGKVCAGNGDPSFGYGGTGCMIVNSALICVCRPEYIGTACSFRLSAVCGDPTCSGHGTCTFSFLTGSYLCICTSGYQGNYCEWPVPQCVYELNGTVCSGNGLCLNTGNFGEPTCQCTPPYAGLYCEYSILDCVESTTQLICANRGVCDVAATCGNQQRRSLDGSTCINTPTSFDICIQQAPQNNLEGYASSFGVLAALGITNVGSSNVCLNLGIGPPPATLNDQGNLEWPLLLHQNDDLYNEGLDDGLAFYNLWVQQPCNTTFGSGIVAGPVSLDVGVYCFPSGASFSGHISLTNVNSLAVPTIFKITGSMTTAAGTVLSLSGVSQPAFTTYLVSGNINFGSFSQSRGSVYSLSGNIVLNSGYSSLLNSHFIALGGTVSLSTSNIQCFTGTPFCGRVTTPPVTLFVTDIEYLSQTFNLGELDCMQSFGSTLRAQAFGYSTFAILSWRYTDCVIESQYSGAFFQSLILSGSLSICPDDTGNVPFNAFLRVYVGRDPSHPWVITKRCFLLDQSILGLPWLLDELTYTARVGDTASEARVQNTALETECQVMASFWGAVNFGCDTIFNQCYIPSANPFTSVTRPFVQADASNPLAHVFYMVGTNT